MFAFYRNLLIDSVKRQYTVWTADYRAMSVLHRLAPPNKHKTSIYLCASRNNADGSIPITGRTQRTSDRII